MTPVQTRFADFVYERERVRDRRSRGNPAPWTEDQILKEFKFCNVNREHDAVTSWIRQNVRPKLATRPLGEVVAQLYLCRIFNEPKVLSLVFPFGRINDKDRIAQAKKNNGKLLRGAYLCVPHGTSMPAEEYFLPHYWEIKAKIPRALTKLSQVAAALTSITDIADFMANQVCADLRYQQGWDRWLDWETFVLAGPGTRRGLYRYMGGTDTTTSRKSPKLTGDCQPALLRIREELKTSLPDVINAHFRDPNNLSNCFCEFDKYERVRQQLASGERITLKRYKYVS